MGFRKSALIAAVMAAVLAPGALMAQSGSSTVAGLVKDGSRVHGSVFESLRDDALDARNFFASSKPCSIRPTSTRPASYWAPRTSA